MPSLACPHPSPSLRETDLRLLPSALLVPLGACVIAALLPHAALAQAPATSDSLPFRSGQWGAQFAVSSGMPAVGVLRFRSPSSAWLLNADLEAASADQSADTEERSSTGAYGSIQLGIREYRPVAARVARYHGAGVLLAYQRQSTESDEPSIFRNDFRAFGPGAYGELGASYLVTRHLSLGATTRLEMRYSRGTQEITQPDGSVNETRTTGFSARVGGIRLVGTLLF